MNNATPPLPTIVQTMEDNPTTRWLKKQWSRFGFLLRQGGKDAAAASIGLIVVWILSFLFPVKDGDAQSGGFWLKLLMVAALFSATCGVLWVLIGKVQKFLEEEADFEGLASAQKPMELVNWQALVLRWPLCTTALASVLMAVTMAALGLLPLGPSLRWNSSNVTKFIPVREQMAALVHWPEEATDIELAARMPGLSFIIQTVYDFLILALAAAWLKRLMGRQSFSKALMTSADASDGKSRPYGLKVDGSEEPHERVLMDRAERIGVACIPSLRIELETTAQRETRGAVVAVKRVFANTRGTDAWREYPSDSAWLRGWLAAQVARFKSTDLGREIARGGHAVAEAMEALATILVCEPDEHVPTPIEGVALAAAKIQALADLRALLREVFTHAKHCPAVFLGACLAAERLGRPEDLALLDEQVSRLDRLDGFSPQQTDTLLLTRDRVMSGHVLGPSRRKQAWEAVLQRGLEPLDGLDTPLPRFRRPKDGRVMLLMAAGSYPRGDDAKPETSPRRRIHVDALLVDAKPVPESALSKWQAEQGSVLRLDDGFFPMQGNSRRSQSAEGAATEVSWYAAAFYAQWVGGRLPTEAEWEKAVREGLFNGAQLEWTWDAYAELAYRDHPEILNPRFVPRDAHCARVVRGRTAETPLERWTPAERMAGPPVTFGLSAPVTFRVVIPLWEGGSL